jgi:hypothetical protein
MLVGLLGFIGSGKGTAGTILNDFNFESISFAGAVKDVTAVMFGWPRNLLEGDTDASRTWREKEDLFWSKRMNKPFTPRLALQLMGTEVGRGVFCSNFWVDRLEASINKNKNYVITDVRFQNEIDFVHKQGGVVIEIQRGVKPHWYDIAAQANHGSSKAESFMKDNVKMHESEWRWIGGGIDYVIDNDGTVDELKEKLLKCLTKTYGSNTMNELTMGVF